MIRGARRAVGLAAISAAARAPAFLIPIIIASVFGAGSNTDAYFLAYSAVLFLGGTLAQGVEQAIVPFAAREIHSRPNTARRFLETAATVNVMAAACCWLLGIPLFALAVQAEVRRPVLVYAVTFTPLALAWCAAAVFGGALVSQSKIGTSTGSMLWRGLGALVGLLAVPWGGGLWGVALGLGAGELLRLRWLHWQLYAHVPKVDRADTVQLGELIRASAAQFAASAAIAGAPVVERLLAASLAVGAVSHLEYAMRLLVVPSVLFDGALVPMVLARWARQMAAGQVQPSRAEVLSIVLKGGGLACVIGLILAVTAPLIVNMLLVHGKFTLEDQAAVVGILRVLSLAFVANMSAQLLERHYIAAMRNRLLAALSLGRAAVRIGVAWSLLGTMGLPAFAVGFAVSDTIYFIGLVVLLRPSTMVTIPKALPDS